MSDPMSGSTFLEATGTSTGRYAGRVLTALGATVITADLTPDSGLGKEPGSRRVWPDSFPQVPWGRIETILTPNGSTARSCPLPSTSPQDARAS